MCSTPRGSVPRRRGRYASTHRRTPTPIGNALAPPGASTVHLSDRKRAPDSISASAVSVLPDSDQPATRIAPSPRSMAAEWTATPPRAVSLRWSAGRTAEPHTALSGKPGSHAKTAGPLAIGSGIAQARPADRTNSRPSAASVTVPSRAGFCSSPVRGARTGSAARRQTDPSGRGRSGGRQRRARPARGSRGRPGRNARSRPVDRRVPRVPRHPNDRPRPHRATSFDITICERVRTTSPSRWRSMIRRSSAALSSVRTRAIASASPVTLHASTTSGWPRRDSATRSSSVPGA